MGTVGYGNDPGPDADEDEDPLLPVTRWKMGRGRHLLNLGTEYNTWDFLRQTRGQGGTTNWASEQSSVAPGLGQSIVI